MSNTLDWPTGIRRFLPTSGKDGYSPWRLTKLSSTGIVSHLGARGWPHRRQGRHPRGVRRQRRQGEVLGNGKFGSWRATTDDDEHYVYAIALL
jgi:hypothetical protein